jgi:hypothetical protein
VLFSKNSLSASHNITGKGTRMSAATTQESMSQPMSLVHEQCQPIEKFIVIPLEGRPDTALEDSSGEHQRHLVESGGSGAKAPGCPAHTTWAPSRLGPDKLDTALASPG